MSKAKASEHAPKNVIAVLDERGLISQITESGLPEAAATGMLSVYCGWDATRPSLQIGNLVPIMMLAHFQRAGHRPLLLVGGRHRHDWRSQRQIGRAGAAQHRAGGRKRRAYPPAA